MTPDEVLRLPPDEELIFIRGQNVFRAKRFDYSRHVDYKKLKSSKAILHEPAWKSSKRAIPLEEIPELKAMHDSKSERKPKRKSSKDEPTMLIEADGSVTLGKRVDDINSKV